ncbi:MAG TPA: hypothetical protein DDW28_06980 [Prevotella sp.]|nr:hypothetical protein [uncultured Prevotella sp.]HBF05830.1 hypothetical protein [Candidatus Segatella violae]
MDKKKMKEAAEAAVMVLKNEGVLEQAQLKADQELAKQASDGDLDAIKLLCERMQDRGELELRKKLFGV